MRYINLRWYWHYPVIGGFVHPDAISIAQHCNWFDCRTFSVVGTVQYPGSHCQLWHLTCSSDTFSTALKTYGYPDTSNCWSVVCGLGVQTLNFQSADRPGLACCSMLGNQTEECTPSLSKHMKLSGFSLHWHCVANIVLAQLAELIVCNCSEAVYVCGSTLYIGSLSLKCSDMARV